MGQSSLLRSPKKEEQQIVPESSYHGIETLEDLRGFLGINNIEDHQQEEEEEEDAQFIYKPQQQQVLLDDCKEHEFLGWDFMSPNWEFQELFPKDEEKDIDESFNNFSNNSDVKRDYFGFWDENVVEETKASLNLNLNYEEVLQAWSNRGSLWAHHHHPSNFSISNTHYLGEVPNLEDEKKRRETSVLRYKEKRQNRLFSKKIRYEVRKLNADKRPRLKGRFVKRVPDDKIGKG